MGQPPNQRAYFDVVFNHFWVGTARCAVSVAQRSAGATASALCEASFLASRDSASTSLGGDIASSRRSRTKTEARCSDL